MRRAAREVVDLVGVVSRSLAVTPCTLPKKSFATSAATSTSVTACALTRWAAPSSTGSLTSLSFFGNNGHHVSPRANFARHFASLRKQTAGDGVLRWVRVGGSGGANSDDDVSVDETRKRYNTARGDRHPSSARGKEFSKDDFETNRQRALNKRVSTAVDTAAALGEFTRATDAFQVNAVNVASLFVVLARCSRLTVDDTNGTAIEKLLIRLRAVTNESSGRVCANVLHALGQLEARDWWNPLRETCVTNQQWRQTVVELVRRSGVTAPTMNAQEIGNAYNGISRLDSFAADAMPTAGWVGLSQGIVTNGEAALHELNSYGEGSVRNHSAKRAPSSSTSQNAKPHSSQFAALAAVLCLNALASDKMRGAVENTPYESFKILIHIVLHAKQVDEQNARSVEKLSEQGLANVLNACAKLPLAKKAVDEYDLRKPSQGWRLLLTTRVPSLAPRFGDQGLSVLLHALAVCGRDARSAVTKNGWTSLAAATKRIAPSASPQAVAMLLNSTWKLTNEPDVREFVLSNTTFFVLGKRAAEIVSEHGETSSVFDEQASFIVADAMGKVPHACFGFSEKAKEYTSSHSKDPWLVLAKRLANTIVDKATERSVATACSTADWSSHGGPAASFHVLCRVSALANALTTKKIWADVGKALKAVAPTCDAEDVSRILNGYCKVRRNELIMESTPLSTWKALGSRVAELANRHEIEPMHLATILDAVKKLPLVRETLETLANKKNNPDPVWDDLATVITQSASELEPLQVTNTVSALGWLPELALGLSRRENGWAIVLHVIEANFSQIAKGVNVSDLDDPKSSLNSSHEQTESRISFASSRAETPEAKKWMEKTAAGLELTRGHAGYEMYGSPEDRAKLLALETKFREALLARRE